MQRFGNTLEEFGHFSASQVVTVGVQLLTILQKLHSIGVVYNDLKWDNVCLENNGDLHSIKLIDFGLCSKYKNEYGSHIMPQEV